jgi:hypothetical protein
MEGKMKDNKEKVCKLEVKNGGKNEDKKFKKGDWIIATEPLIIPENNMFSLGGPQFRKDRQYMDKPIKVLGVTDQHIVYQYKHYDGTKSKSILPMYDVKERKFIIADKILVDAIK